MKQIKVYVAGASREIEIAEKMILGVRTCGHLITLDWPQAIRESARRTGELAANGPSIPHTSQVEAAKDCADAVRNADIFWLLVPKRGTETAGCWVEYGIAHAEQVKNIIVSGEYQKSIFCAAAHARFDRHSSALDYIRGMR